MKKAALLLIGVVVAACGVWKAIRFATAPTPDAYDSSPILVERDPDQVELAEAEPIRLTYSHGAAILKPVAKYRLGGRVCGLNHLHGGYFDDLFPYDICMAWGHLLDPAMADKIEFKHDSLRLAWVSLKRDSPLTFEYVGSHFSNSHLLCASRQVCEALARIDEGDEIELTGYLVFAKITVDGREREWNSSLVRSDTGLGACETIYVVSVRRGDKVYGEPLRVAQAASP